LYDPYTHPRFNIRTHPSTQLNNLSRKSIDVRARSRCPRGLTQAGNLSDISVFFNFSFLQFPGSGQHALFISIHRPW
jgi:hypothetical protein